MAKITINQTLNTFADANTQSAKTGKIAPGQYNIVSTKNNYPDSTTDYVELFDPNQDKNIWICSRYKTNVYAIIETINQQNTELNSFDNDDFAIDEKAIVDLLPAFYNFTYNLQNPKGKKELLTEEIVELLTSPLELSTYKDAILEAMLKGSKRNIESEDEPVKNAEAG